MTPAIVLSNEQAVDVECWEICWLSAYSRQGPCNGNEVRDSYHAWDIDCCYCCQIARAWIPISHCC